jgi:hypothetical protein
MSGIRDVLLIVVAVIVLAGAGLAVYERYSSVGNCCKCCTDKPCVKNCTCPELHTGRHKR